MLHFTFKIVKLKFCCICHYFWGSWQGIPYCKLYFHPSIFLLLHLTEQLSLKKKMSGLVLVLSHNCTHTLWIMAGGLQRSVLALNYLLPNLANMQVICGVATSQLSHLLSAAPNPPIAATFPTNMPSPPTLTPPAVTFIASLVCSTCTGARPHSASLQTLTTFGRSVRDEGMMRDSIY